MILLLVLLTLVLAVLLLRLPAWLSRLGLGLGLVMALAAAALGGVERAAGVLISAALMATLLAPWSSRAWRDSRDSKVAPRRGRTPGAGEAPGEDYIPGYELLDKVGSGGMASVYRARRKKDGEVVALKIPMEQYLGDSKFIRRFHREAEVAQRLDHDNIVRTLEHGKAGDRHFMVMEFVDGRSLEASIDADELTVALSLEIMKRVVIALQHIHGAGIIHRDIKPANVMILKGAIGEDEGGEPRLDPNGVKLMDFGIAGGKVTSRLTMSGARVGTPVYMSPEQARGLRTNFDSDVYSLGLVFYEMLTGQTAFRGSYEAIVHQQIFQTPAPPRQLNLQVPKAVDALVMQMIAKEAENRPGLGEVLASLCRPDLKEEQGADMASRLLVTVSARQGVLRVFDTSGNLHTSVADIGVAKDNFSAAPVALAADGRGSLYAAIFDYRVGSAQQEMIHKLDAAGTKVSSFGPYGPGEAELLHPISLAVGSGERIYVLDLGRHRVQAYSAGGGFIGGFGGKGSGRGLLNDPKVVVAGPDGSLYVLDYGNKQVQHFSEGGSYLSRWAFKLAGGQGGMRLLDGLTVDGRGNLYISDASARKIRRIDPDGKLGVSYSVNLLRGEAADSLLDLGVDDAGYLYAARRGGHLIRKYDPGGRLLATFETYAPTLQMLVEVRH